MNNFQKLFKKLGYLIVFLNAYLAFAQIEETVIKHDPALDEIIDDTAKVSKIAGDFGFTEGPVWNKEGYLLFSDIPKSTIYKWTPDGKLSTFQKQINKSNGLTYDKKGNLLICEHGSRGIAIVSSKGEYKIIIHDYKGKKFNSPNDIVVKSDGSYYFTDPPYGLKKQDADSSKELTTNGVYRSINGKTELLIKDLHRPNGLAFSPDEKYLYVANTEKPKIWMKYEVKKDGLLNNGSTLFDPSNLSEAGGPDGMKSDIKGNLYCTGPGGVLIISPKGIHLGTIKFPEIPSNCAFGDNDNKTLYVTARTGVYKVMVKIPGVLTY